MTDVKTTGTDAKVQNSETQTIAPTSITNQDIEQLKELYPLPDYTQEFENAIAQIESVREEEAEERAKQALIDEQEAKLRSGPEY